MPLHYPSFEITMMSDQTRKLYEKLPDGPSTAKLGHFKLKEWEIIDKQKHSCLLACVFIGALYYQHHCEDVEFKATRNDLQAIADHYGASRRTKGITLTWVQRYLDPILQNEMERMPRKIDLEIEEEVLEVEEDIETEEKRENHKFFYLDVISVMRYTDLLLPLLLVKPPLIQILQYDPLAAEGRGKSMPHAALLWGVDLDRQTLSILDPARYDPRDPHLEPYEYTGAQFDRGWRLNERKVIRMCNRAQKNLLEKSFHDLWKESRQISLERFFQQA